MKKLVLALLFLSLSLLAKDISSYLNGNYQTTDNVKSALSSNGFNVIGEYNAMGDSDYHVIVYTCPGLTKLASKKTRGFAGVQKVLVDAKAKNLVFTNPEYFMPAFLQDDNNPKIMAKVSSKLNAAFSGLKGGTSKLEDDDISGFHFMMGMPYYEDMIELAEGEDLAKNLESKADVVFKLKVGEATLYGIAMNNEKEFVNAIDAAPHAAFLPYMVLIEDNKAFMLHGKYYLAISNPLLSMGDFMNISSTPGDIEDYITTLVTK
jgi:hypothetical protein